MSDVNSDKSVEAISSEPVLTTSRTNEVRNIDVDPAAHPVQRHVLVIEDDPIILYLLQDVLNAGGFKVLVAKTAADGLALFENYSKTTFCVILDYGIPGMHAARLLERMQEIQSKVSVILSSGYPQNFIKEDFPFEKLAGFLAKPYDPQVLIAELNRLKEEKGFGE